MTQSPGTHLLTVLSSTYLPCAPRALAEFATLCSAPLLEVQGLKVVGRPGLQAEAACGGKAPGVVQPVSAVSSLPPVRTPSEGSPAHCGIPVPVGRDQVAALHSSGLMQTLWASE